MEIDRNAPVVAELTVDIAAPPPEVWAVLADIEGWSAIYPELKDVQVDGPVGPGTAFSFRSGPGKIEAEVGEVDEDQRLTFVGKGMGATSVYVFTLTPSVDGGTHLEVAQSISGLAAKTMSAMLTRISNDSLRDWTDAIREHAESRTA